MSIKYSELENMNITLDYFNSIKQISDELIKYIKNYKQLIQEFLKKLQSFQTNFRKKLSKSENPKISKATFLTSKLTQLIDQNNELYQLSIDDIDLRLKQFDSQLKLKNDSIKAIQKLSSELNKGLINSFNEVNKAKTNYLNSLSKTEEIINKYYTDKNRIIQHNSGLGQKLNDNEYILLKEQQKNQLNDMNNALKASKNLEVAYKNSISSSIVIHDKYVENHNTFKDKIKNITCELSDEIKSLIVSFMLSYKNNYRQPLGFIDICIDKFNLIDEKKEVDTIITQSFKNDNELRKISPVNYKLKSISLLKDTNYLKKQDNQPQNNNKNNNILQRQKSISKLQDGFDEMEYISDDSLVLTIKSLFDNFTLIDKDEFNLKEEESKSKTQNYIIKIITNMNSYPYSKFGKNSNKPKESNTEYKRKELSPEEIDELTGLLENHQNRIIFLQKLSDYRSRGKFYLCPEDYELLSKFFNIISDKVKRDMDYHAAEMIIIISQTYCIEEGKTKKYLQKNLKQNKLFKDKTFWEEFLFYSINKEIMKTMNRDQMAMENKKNMDRKISNVVFSQVLTLIDNMFEFEMEAQTIKEILEPKVKYYKLDDSLKNTINDVIISKENEKAIEREELEKKNNKIEEENKKKDEKTEEETIQKEEEKIKGNVDSINETGKINKEEEEKKAKKDSNEEVKKEGENSIKKDEEKQKIKENEDNKKEEETTNTEKKEDKNIWDFMK